MAEYSKTENSSSRTFRIVWQAQRKLALFISIKQKSVRGKTAQVLSCLTTNLTSKSCLIHSTYRNIVSSYWRTFPVKPQRFKLSSTKEMVSILISTLASPFYERLIGVPTTDFVTLIQVGERKENGAKIGRISSGKLKFQISNWGKSIEKAWGRDNPRCRTQRKGCSH